MGCASSGCASSDVDERPLSNLLSDVAQRIRKNPSSVTDADVDLIDQIYTDAAARGGVNLAYTMGGSGAKGGSGSMSNSTIMSPAHDSSAAIVLDSWHRATEEIGMVVLGERVVERVLQKRPQSVICFASGLSRTQRGLAMARMLNQTARTEMAGPTFVPSLLNQGARHSSYGVDGPLLQECHTATMEVLHDALAAEGGLTKEEVSAWDGLWETTINLMVHGMNSELGQRNRQRFEAQNARDVQSLWQKIRLAQADAGERLFTRYMYKRVLERFPELSRFSNLTDFRTAERIMGMLTTIVDNRAEGFESTNVTMMRESGARHVAYGVTMEDMRCFLPAFLDACEYYLGEHFDIVARYQLDELWDYTVRGFEVGLMGYAGEDAKSAPQSPDGIAMVFTDIEKSTRLWELNPQSMSEAHDRHCTILRQLINHYHGYEVKAIGDSFMVAFASIVDAVLFSCSIQTELMLTAPLAPGFRMVRTDLQGGGPASVWDHRTLRVRVGIEWCQQYSAQYDPVHRRYDYFGPSINVAARVEGNAAGGQVLMTADAVEQLRRDPAFNSASAPREFTDLRDMMSTTAAKGNATREEPSSTSTTTNGSSTLKDGLHVTKVATQVKLKGVRDGIDLYQVAPRSLKGRKFDTAKRLANHDILLGPTVLTSANTSNTYRDTSGSDHPPTSPGSEKPPTPIIAWEEVKEVP